MAEKVINMQNKDNFTNPYEGIPKADIHRTTINLYRKDLNEMKRMHGREGFMQTTINILVDKLYHELQRIGFSEYNPDEYERLVGGCVITCPGPGHNGTGPTSPIGGSFGDNQPDAKVLNPNEPGGVAGVVRDSIGATQPSDAGSAPTSAGKRRNKRTKG